MARSTGLTPRRAYHIDAEHVVVGAVGAGARGRAAETREGEARLLSTALDAQMLYKAVIFGQSDDAAGGYLLEVGHVALGDEVGDAEGWVTIAILEADGIGKSEAALSGAEIYKKVKAELDPGVEPRVVAVRATAGDEVNGAAEPAGTITITLQPDA